jgi:hypothetical protein
LEESASRLPTSSLADFAPLSLVPFTRSPEAMFLSGQSIPHKQHANRIDTLSATCWRKSVHGVFMDTVPVIPVPGRVHNLVTSKMIRLYPPRSHRMIQWVVSKGMIWEYTPSQGAEDNIEMKKLHLIFKIVRGLVFVNFVMSLVDFLTPSTGPGWLQAGINYTIFSIVILLIAQFLCYASRVKTEAQSEQNQ